MRACAHRAIVELRARRPHAATEIEALVREAEKTAAVEMSRSPRKRDPLRVEGAWGRVMRTAAQRVGELRRYEAGLAERCAELEREVDLRVEESRSSMRQAGMGRREAMAMSRAETELANARRLVEIRDYERAIVSAERALVFAEAPRASLQTMLARFSDRKLLRTWRQWVEETVESSRESGGSAIVVDKLAHRLILYRRGHVEATFTVELGANGLRPKYQSGDQATPEGKYRIVAMKQRSATKFYKALLIDYPNREDLLRFREAREAGSVPRGVGAGGLIEIHGEGGGGRDWTDGCVALANEDMDRLFAGVSDGTPVTIVGTF